MTSQLTLELILNKCKCDNLEDVKNLNLWGNELEDIEIIKDLINVEVISLSVNFIKTLNPFKYCHKLCELYLRKNHIENLNEILYLKNCESLRILWLEENPICVKKDYRHFTIFHLTKLIKLDNNQITSEEKEISNLLFNKEIYIEEDSLITPIYNKISDVKINRKLFNITNDDKDETNYNSLQNRNFSNKIIPNVKLNPQLLNKETPIKSYINIEEDYMNKFKNLDELTEFFSHQNHQSKNIKNNTTNTFKKNNSENMSRPMSNKHINNSITKGLTFNESVKVNNNSSSQFYKKQNEEIINKNNKFLPNLQIIKAIDNLLEEMNSSQLNFIKRVIDKKLKREYDSII